MALLVFFPSKMGRFEVLVFHPHSNPLWAWVWGPLRPSASSGLQLVTDRSGWEDGCWPCLSFPGPSASGHPRPPTSPHWRTHVSASEDQFLYQLPTLPDLYLLHPMAPLASHLVGSASTRSPWAPDIHTSLYLGPNEALPPGLPVQGLLLSSQTPTGLCLRLQHPAWLVLFAPPRSSSCSLPVVLLAVGLLGVGGAPFPLASSLYITSASSPIPLGSSKGGRFINFFFQGK